MRLRFNQDIAAGLLFMAFGLAAYYIGQDYRPGTSLRMGPGYFPRILSWLLIGLGAIIAIRGMVARAEPLTRWYLRPLILILVSLLAFRYLIDSAGLVLATIAAVGIGAAGGSEFRASEVAILVIGLAVGGTLLFSYALGLPMKVWPI